METTYNINKLISTYFHKLSRIAYENILQQLIQQQQSLIPVNGVGLQQLILYINLFFVIEIASTYTLT